MNAVFLGSVHPVQDRAPGLFDLDTFVDAEISAFLGQFGGVREIFEFVGLASVIKADDGEETLRIQRMFIPEGKDLTVFSGPFVQNRKAVRRGNDHVVGKFRRPAPAAQQHRERVDRVLFLAQYRHVEQDRSARVPTRDRR